MGNQAEVVVPESKKMETAKIPKGKEKEILKTEVRLFCVKNFDKLGDNYRWKVCLNKKSKNLGFFCIFLFFLVAVWTGCGIYEEFVRFYHCRKLRPSFVQAAESKLKKKKKIKIIFFRLKKKRVSLLNPLMKTNNPSLWLHNNLHLHRWTTAQLRRKFLSPQLLHWRLLLLL